jgi:hypothetical protein
VELLLLCCSWVYRIINLKPLSISGEPCRCCILCVLLVTGREHGACVRVADIIVVHLLNNELWWGFGNIFLPQVSGITNYIWKFEQCKYIYYIIIPKYLTILGVVKVT